MKKLITTLGLTCLVISFLGFAEASSGFSDTSNKEINDNEYYYHSMSFKNPDELLKNNNGVELKAKEKHMRDIILQKTEEENIEALMKFVKQLDINGEQYIGLEEAYLKGIKSFLHDNAYLTEYTIKLPKQRYLSRNTTYFGSHEGVEMRYFTSYSSVWYKRVLVGGDDLSNWFFGGLDLAMAFIPFPKVTIPYTILRNVPKEYTSHSSDEVEARIVEGTTSRFILAQDVKSNPNNYIAVYTDQKKNVRTDLVVTINDPNIGTSINGTFGPTYHYTKYYFNRSKILKDAFYKYLSGDGSTLITYRLPRAKIYWY